ncbi:alpha/beta hydrolase [Roseateles noduli]|jgi:pimeloyl-ACP methyl ester carboxylesterase|uniref:alpha/beta hydrolase n=1 Tax=Roseateles noduli TaxID=2052484 RepID=UPI003D64FD6A
MNITRRLIATAVAASAFAASAGLSTVALAATPAASAQPSVVIVHGAFADGSDWAKVIPLLQREGVQVTAVQNPLSSLADDVAAARRAIDAQPGKVVLVGHSWGGTVITEAGTSDKVASLVYVAAFAPNVGQNTAEQGKGFPTPSGLAHFKADAQGWLSLTAEGMKNHFAQDLPAATTAVMTATQGPIQAKAFEQAVSAAAWKTKPSYYLLATADHMIAPEAQAAMAQRAGAKVTKVDSSHVPQQSQPEAVAKVILDAVRQSR